MNSMAALHNLHPLAAGGGVRSTRHEPTGRALDSGYCACSSRAAINLRDVSRAHTAACGLATLVEFIGFRLYSLISRMEVLRWMISSLRTDMKNSYWLRGLRPYHARKSHVAGFCRSSSPWSSKKRLYCSNA